MYRPANYYAARRAAINEVLSEVRAEVRAAIAESQRKVIEVPHPYSTDDLHCLGTDCAFRLSTFLCDDTGHTSSEILHGTMCYRVCENIYLVKYLDPVTRDEHYYKVGFNWDACMYIAISELTAS